MPEFPADHADGSPSKLKVVSDAIAKFDLVLIPGAIGVALAAWGVIVILTITGRHMAPLRYTSKIRAFFINLAAIAWSTSFGYYALECLAHVQVARVRWEMDAWVLIPIGVNIGIAIGTAFVGKLERKRLAKAELHDMERAISVQEFLAEEKQPLVEA